ncbi:MAG: cytidine deaminase [bacterium]
MKIKSLSLFTPLLDAAAAAGKRAYCPYSRYPVGAAVEAEDGTIFTGVNVENASYGLTICAERVAIAAAVTCGHRRVRRLALVAGTARRPALPCGACLQVIAEFATPDFEILIAPRGRTKQFVRYVLRDLLPFPFSLRNYPYP